MLRNKFTKALISSVLFAAMSVTSVGGFATGSDNVVVNLLPPDRYWSIVDEIARKALNDNPYIRGVRNGEAVAGQLARQAGLFENPTLSLQLDRRRGGMDRDRMLGVEMPLPIDGRREAAVRTARAGVDESRFKILDEERRFVMMVRETVTNLVAARMRRDLLSLNLSLAERNKALTAEAVDQGLRAPLDLNREVVFVNSLRARVEIAEADVTELEAELAAALGRADLDGISLPSSLPGSRLEDFSRQTSILDQAIERPDFLSSRSSISVAKGRLDQSRADGRPRFDLMFGIRDMRLGFPFLGLDGKGGFSPIEDSMRYTSLGLKIKLPLFNRNQGAVSASRFELDSANQFSEGLRLNIQGEIAGALSRFKRTNRSLGIMVTGVVEPARENFRVLRISYEEGLASLDEFLREQRGLIEIEIEGIESARANAVAEAALISAVGAGNYEELLQMVGLRSVK